jgi:hypothetical protein
MTKRQEFETNILTEPEVLGIEVIREIGEVYAEISQTLYSYTHISSNPKNKNSFFQL